MKYSFKLLAFALLSFVTGHAQTTIQFDVTGLTNGYDVHIFKMEGLGGTTAYHQFVTDGKFNCTFTCDTLMENLSHFDVNIMDRQAENTVSFLSIYLNKGDKIHVKGNGDDARDWTTDSNHPGQKFYDTMNRTGEVARLSKEMDKIFAQIRMPEADRDALFLVHDSLYNLSGKIQVKLLESLPVDKYWLGHYAMMTRAASSDDVNQEIVDSLVKLYDRLTDDDKRTTDGKTATANLFNKPVKVGDQMKDYDLYDIDGNLHHLADFKGREFLVDFGSYFCGPCRLVEPFLDYLYKAGNKSFEIVSLNNDSQSQFEENARIDDVSYNVLHDKDGDGGIFGLYKIHGIPTFYLFGADGTVKDTWMGAYPERIFNSVVKNDQFKWNTTVEQKDGAKVVTYPKFDSVSTPFVADKVTLYADSTVIDFISSVPDASFGSGSVLRANGKEYKVISSSIGLDKYVQGQLGKGLRITATFEPLPADTQMFDYIEGECDSCFKIMGIEIPQR